MDSINIKVIFYNYKSIGKNSDTRIQLRCYSNSKFAKIILEMEMEMEMES